MVVMVTRLSVVTHPSGWWIHHPDEVFQSLEGENPTNGRGSPNAGVMLGQRRRQWSSTEPALGRH